MSSISQAASFLLFLAYYAVLTPVGLVWRLVGFDPMARRPAPEAATYWRRRPVAGAASMRRQD
jgi:hypothetical protein